MKKQKKNLECIRQGWVVLSVNLIIFCFLFALINVLIAFLTPREILSKNNKKDAETLAMLQRWGPERLAKMYPGKTENEIVQILAAQNQFQNVYEPFIQFRITTPNPSETFRVDEAGFRSIGSQQEAWPPNPKNFNVFIFGGSTTFGAGVKNDETFACFLQKILRDADIGRGRTVCVYNFGMQAYISSQERILFEQLLQKNIVPDAAVFVDGLNDMIQWDGEPALTPFFRMSLAQAEQSWRKDGLWDHARWFFERLPICNLVRMITQQKTKVSPFPQVSLDQKLLQNKAKYSDVIQRYAQNVTMLHALGDAFGVKIFCFWQPISYYKYPFEKEAMDVLSVMEEGHHYGLRAKYGYDFLLKHMEAFPKKTIWAADIQSEAKTWLYVDHVHYNVEGHQLLAKFIAQSMIEKENNFSKNAAR